VIEVIVKAAFPLLVRVSGAVAKAPTCTEPKLIELGDVVRLGPPAEIPIPESPSDTRDEAGSLLAKVRMPDCGPDAVGAKRTVTWVLSPAAILKGPAGETVNIGLELAIDVTVRVP
jgi:hypothetical protein